MMMSVVDHTAISFNLPGTAAPSIGDNAMTLLDNNAAPVLADDTAIVDMAYDYRQLPLCKPISMINTLKCDLLLLWMLQVITRVIR